MDLRVYLLGRLLAQWFQLVGQSHAPAPIRAVVSSLGVMHSRVLVSCTFTVIHVRAYEHRLEYSQDTMAFLPPWVRTLESVSILAFWVWCLSLCALVVVGILEGEAPALEVATGGQAQKWFNNGNLREDGKQALHAALRISAAALWTLPLLVSPCLLTVGPFGASVPGLLVLASAVLVGLPHLAVLWEPQSDSFLDAARGVAHLGPAVAMVAACVDVRRVMNPDSGFFLGLIYLLLAASLALVGICSMPPERPAKVTPIVEVGAGVALHFVLLGVIQSAFPIEMWNLLGALLFFGIAGAGLGAALVSKRIHELLFDDILVPLIVLRPHAEMISGLRKAMWGVTLGMALTVLLFGPSATGAGGAAGDMPATYDGEYAHHSDYGDYGDYAHEGMAPDGDAWPEDVHWRDGFPLGSEERPALIACSPQFAAHAAEYEHEVLESAKKIYSADISADVVVVALGAVPNTKCRAFSVSVSASGDVGDAVWSALHAKSDTAWDKVLASLADFGIATDAPFKKVDFNACEASDGKADIKAFCDWLSEYRGDDDDDEDPSGGGSEEVKDT